VANSKCSTNCHELDQGWPKIWPAGHIGHLNSFSKKKI
jgi:hypothetical protein